MAKEGNEGGAEAEVVAFRVLRVRLDDALQGDIDEAKRRTGLRTDAELVRLALRRLAQGDEARGG